MILNMKGKESNPFAGTFDGGGHTLTVDYADIGEENAAPFRYASGASFSNLRVAGQLATSNKYASGLVGHAYGNIHITDVRVSVVLISSFSGAANHGGFIAHATNPFHAYFKGCVFDGQMLGNETTACGGFVGYFNGIYSDGIGV